MGITCLTPPIFQERKRNSNSCIFPDYAIKLHLYKVFDMTTIGKYASIKGFVTTA